MPLAVARREALVEFDLLPPLLLTVINKIEMVDRSLIHMTESALNLVVLVKAPGITHEGADVADQPLLPIRRPRVLRDPTRLGISDYPAPPEIVVGDFSVAQKSWKGFN